jgi:hypothetical protein
MITQEVQREERRVRRRVPRDQMPRIELLERTAATASGDNSAREYAEWTPSGTLQAGEMPTRTVDLYR